MHVFACALLVKKICFQWLLYSDRMKSLEMGVDSEAFTSLTERVTRNDSDQVD